MCRQFARKRRQNPLDPHSQTGIDRDDGLRRRSRFAQVRVVVGVQHRLIIHEGMDGGDRGCLDTKRLGKRRENRHDCICRARRRRHNIHVPRERLGIHPINNGCIHIRLGGMRKQHPPRATVQVLLRSRAIGKGAGAFKHQINAKLPPW